MNWKLAAGIGVAVVVALVAGALVLKKRHQPAGVTVTLRIAVSPAEQAGFVAAQANSARFKYLMGKDAGVKPVLAQKLSVRALPNSPVVEAQIVVPTEDEGRRYAEGFISTLQLVCGKQARVTLADQGAR